MFILFDLVCNSKDTFQYTCSTLSSRDSFLPICRVNDFEIADILYPSKWKLKQFLMFGLNLTFYLSINNVKKEKT